MSKISQKQAGFPPWESGLWYNVSNRIRDQFGLKFLPKNKPQKETNIGKE